MHRDIRAKNVLITINETAKLTNIRSSRDHFLLNKRLVQNQNLEWARYRAPELLFKRAPGFKYDQKCDVYSRGLNRSIRNRHNPDSYDWLRQSIC